MGLKIKHPNKDHLALDDLFVYPDLEHVTSRSSAITYTEISAKKSLQKFQYQYILGTEKSGKSTLVRKYCSDLSQNYDVILLDGCEIKHTKTEELIRVFKKKFGIEKEFNRDLALIIDDFHDCNLNDRYIDDFFKNICSDFKTIIFFVDKQRFVGDRAKHLNSNFDTFEIKSFGHLKRNELYTKWYNIGLENVAVSDDKDFIEKIDTLTSHFDLLLRKNVMDSKPINILTIIQTLDNINLSRDFTLTSYGHCYNTLILGLLNKAGVKPQDFDSILSFLSYLSFKIFSDEKNKFSNAYLFSVIEEYKQTYILFENIENILLDSNILYINENEDYIFSQPYIYFFCCSRYIAHNEKKLPTILKKLCDGIHTEYYANILIFLVHHSSSDEFLNQILTHSTKILNQIHPHRLTQAENLHFNSTFKDVIENEIKQIRLEQKNIFDEREKLLSARDKSSNDHPIDTALENINSEIPKKDIKENIEFYEMQDANSAFRCLEVLGQIAKNNYGSLQKEKLNQLLTESGFVAQSYS